MTARLPVALLLGAGLLLCGCGKTAPAPTAPAPTAVQPPGDAAAAPAKAEPFTVIDAWDGPALTCRRNFATRKVVFTAKAPTAGYTLSHDGAEIVKGNRSLQLTLLQPAGAAAQVVTDVSCEIDDALLVSKEPMVVAVRRMQKDAHYLVAPPYVLAMTQQ